MVVAAGNDGNQTDSLTNPAIDPYVLAVGAADHRGTEDRKDDVVASFSNRGSVARMPDLVAPGRSIVSLRVPGSFVDQQNPTAVVNSSKGAHQFRGSGTSQAAAFVSGAVALLLQQRPSLTPDQVKRLLMSTADPIGRTDRRLQGAGLINIKTAAGASTPKWTQSWAQATGLGSLEAARGSHHVADPIDGTELVGEQDIFGQPWDAPTWTEASAHGRSWKDGEWNGAAWTGDGWSSTDCAARSWKEGSWTARSWKSEQPDESVLG